NNDREIINMTVAALMLFAPSYLFTWFNMVTSAFLTALDKPKESMIIMTFRAVVFPLACMLILTHFMGVYGIFFTAPVAGLMTFTVALFIWIKTARQLKKTA
ncbi:MAG: polysaccharide biosynthesis C-terminal domain-containing protein, partial [Oscillospiraceae bacterium]